MWIVAACFNDYQTPKRYRIAYNVENSDWMVDEGAQWLLDDNWFAVDTKRPKGQQKVYRREDPEAWMQLLPQAFHGVHASCRVEEVESLDDLPPLKED